MNKKTFFRSNLPTSPARNTWRWFLSLLCLIFAFGAKGAALTWDADPGSDGPQDGSGTWMTGGTGWWDGSANVNWTSGDVATFGAGTDGNYTITVEGPITSATPLTFNNSGYTLSAESATTITLGGTISVAAGKFATVGTNVEASRSGAWTLSGPGTLNISGSGSRVGTTAGTSSTIGGGATVNVFTNGTLFCGNSIQMSGVSGGSTLVVDGGTVSVGGSIGSMIVNSSGSGSATLTLKNGGTLSTVSKSSGGLRFGSSTTTGWGVLNLDGGTLTTARIFENTASISSTNNFNGGVLQALIGTSHAADFMTGLDRANVRDGGAIIDPNGQDITIPQALLHSDISGDNAIDGGLTVIGSGTLTLTGANTYTGPTKITDGGKLVIDPAFSNLGSAVVVSNGGRLQVTAGSSSSVLPRITLNDGGIDFDLGVYNPANVPAIIDADLLVEGNNVIDISGGSIPVTSIILINYTNKSGTGDFVLGTLPPGVTATLTDTGSALVLNVTSPSGNSYVWSAGSGDWDFVTPNWNSGTSVYDETLPALVTFPDAAAGAVNIPANVNPYSIELDATSGNYTLGGAGSIGEANSFSKTGSKSLTLTSANSYPGETTLGGGSIVVMADQALGNATGGTTVAPATSLALSGSINYSTEEPLEITGPGVVGNHFFSGSATQRGALQSLSGNNTWAGDITFNPLDSNVRIGVQDDARLTLSGDISERTNGMSLIFRLGNFEGSDITISGTNNHWTGETAIYGGGGAALHLGADNALPKTAVLRVGIGGIGGDCVFDLNGFNQEVAGLAGDVVGIVRNDGSQASTLTLNPTPDQLFPGMIQDGANQVGIVKTGDYTQIFAGNSTYTGPTIVNAGSLRIDGFLGSTPVTVNAGAALDGTGTLGGSVTVNAGGTLRVGVGGIGTLTLNDGLDLAGDLVFKVDKSLTPANDLINVFGALNNTGTGSLFIYNTGTNELEVGDSFTLFNQPVNNGSALTIVAPTGVTFQNNLATDGSITVLNIAGPIPTTPTNILYSVSDGQIHLSWPSNYVGWILQAQTNTLSEGLGTNWVHVPGSESVSEMNFPVSVTDPAVFFRLVYPNQP